MEEYVEFSGKDVDDAIANACKHFGIERDKLEIEIVSGGSSGIFGLVGVKKARLLAKKRGAIEEDEPVKAFQDAAPAKTEQPMPARKTGSGKSQPKPKPEPRKKSMPEPKQDPASKPAHEPALEPEKEPARDLKAGLNFETDKEEKKAETEKMDVSVLPSDPGTEDPELREYVHGLMVHLTEPLSPGAEIIVNDQSKPISVIIKDETTSEVLIGKDGQTLSAIQYIANRIIAKNRPGAARVQLDTEDFLEKQNEKLQENAFQLAVKAKQIGKTMSTRPLSSYHRRIVHMALQNDKKIRTKSKGDGPMKRVLIMPKQRRKKPSQD
jgi:spoIIIJ-associated protein